MNRQTPPNHVTVGIKCIQHSVSRVVCAQAMLSFLNSSRNLAYWLRNHLGCLYPILEYLSESWLCSQLIPMRI